MVISLSKETKTATLSLYAEEALERLNEASKNK
jgi:hypothetical protein